MEWGKKIIFTFKVSIGLILTALILLIILKLMYYIASLVYLNPLERFEPINIKNMLGDILLVFVLIELLRTVYIYITQQDVYLNAIFEAALVAVLRKIILVEVEKLDPLYIISLTIILLGLSYVYFKMMKDQRTEE